MERGFLNQLLRSDKTVFSFKDLILLWGNIDKKTAKARANYYTKHGGLYSIRRGLYAKDKKYDKFELATKIYTPSYISFETVLTKAGIIFQYYSQIFVASYQSKDIVCDGQTYNYKTVKAPILTNSAGIKIMDNYSIASSERAFLDLLYLNQDYHFDNLSAINWERVQEILPTYDGNKRMAQIVSRYQKNVT
ncbi:hypothetical protein ACFL52_00670 [Candidatus Margulisiibacteriota bacterium]